MFTIAPFPAASMTGSAARVVRTAAIRLRVSEACQSSSVISPNPPGRAGAAPTLLTRMSIRSPAAATSRAGALVSCRKGLLPRRSARAAVRLPGQAGRHLPVADGRGGGQAHPHREPAAGQCLQAEFAAVGGDDGPHDRQAEAGAVPGPLLAGPAERLQQAV